MQFRAIVAAAVWAAASTIGCANLANAASYQVSPAGIELSQNKPADALTVENASGDTLVIQVRVFRWTQVNGQDQFEPATDLAASPAVVRVPGNGSQLVRILRTTNTPVTQELAYRLIVDEIPNPQQAHDTKEKPKVRAGISFAIRYSVPVFVVPGQADNANKPKANLTAQLLTDPTPALLVTNKAPNRAQLGDLQIGDKKIDGLSGYVLAGNSARVRIPKGAKVDAGTQVKVNVNGSPQTLTVTAGAAAP